MSINENWQRLYNFWKELSFEKAKEYHIICKKPIGERSKYIDEDNERLKNWVLFDREFQPAQTEEIVAIENSLNVTLPQSYKESLLINAYEPHDNAFVYPWLGEWNMMNEPEDIIEQSMSNKELDYELFADTKNLVKEDYKMWSDKWIVIFDWNYDYLVTMDLREEPQFYGKVLCMSLKDGTLAKWADSYEEWFSLVVDEVLEYGILRISTIEKILSNRKSLFAEITDLVYPLNRSSF